ncbi:MAG: AarF/ABC1/UbiB kinase family protein [Candidatus Moranbacteria bacterium]|nr:AarF/ABC1/UbiB kinase family protein [Candidatus Moranbacteria bacterium]
MWNLNRKYQNFKRAKEIILVLARFGFGYIFNTKSTGKILGVSERKIKSEKGSKEVLQMKPPKRLRVALEELGPTFIKLGQILSARPDVLPAEYTDELTNLQDAVPPFSYEEVREQIHREFGKEVEEVFAEFNKKPIAAASLSQVHEAKSADGSKLAVKVQRPGIRNTIETDISILNRLAQFVEKRMRWSRIYQPTDLVKEFSQVIRQELDFVREAHNIEGFRKNFSGNEMMFVPKVFWKFTTEKILTMELVEGKKINKVIDSQNQEYNKKTIASRLTNSVLKQIFQDGYFHGDPHPGNIFVMKNGRIAFLDFGIVGHLEDKIKDYLADMLVAITQRDVGRIIRIWKDMEIMDPLEESQSLRQELKGFLDKYYGMESRKIHLGRLLEELIEIMVRYEIKAPASFALLTKAVINVEGICRRLNPKFNMVSYTEPYAKDLLKKKFSLKELFRKSSALGSEALDLLGKTPQELYLLSKGLREGKLSIGFKHEHLEDLTLVIDRASNRITFGLITAALIVGSSFVMTIDKGPFLFGYPVFGFFGFMIAGVLGLGLVISIIIRRGKL